jgi:hypothetical protein
VGDGDSETIAAGTTYYVYEAYVLHFITWWDLKGAEICDAVQHFGIDETRDISPEQAQPLGIGRFGIGFVAASTTDWSIVGLSALLGAWMTSTSASDLPK